MRPLDEAIIRSELGSRPPAIWYTWSPLWTLSEKEKAETNKLNAEADKTYVETGLIAEPALSRAFSNLMI